MDGSVGQNSQFEYDTLWDTQPVKADKRGSDMLRPSDTEDEEQCSSVLDRLKTLDEVGGKSEQDAVAIVQSRQDQCNNQRLEHCSWYLPPDGTQLAKNSKASRRGQLDMTPHRQIRVNANAKIADH